MLRILVINTGSSSIKFSVFDMRNDEECFASQIEFKGSMEESISAIQSELKKSGQHNVDAVGHRVAHGGDKFKDACLIDDTVINDIEDCDLLAPIHNPPILSGIKICRTIWNVPQVAVFDTSFHQSMPEHATTYAIPEEWRKNGVKRYGFHGTSHRYIMLRVANELKIAASKLRIISCHLGNGASVCAIKNGQSIDTSMGLTPLEGLVMGTRSGDLDPGIFNYLNKTLGLSISDIENALYHKSGLTGLSGVSNNMHDISKRADAGDLKAQLAIEIYSYRLKKYIGSYAAAMGGADVIAFTGGIGENASYIRNKACANLEFLGVHFDSERNRKLELHGFDVESIHTNISTIKVMVMKTREELMIAQDTYRLLTT